MPGRNPFAAVNECLVNHPGISQYFFEFYFAKLYLGWEEQPWLGSLKIKNCRREVENGGGGGERSSPSPKRSSSSLELVSAFCFFKYRFLF